MKLQREKLEGTVKTSFIEKVKKNSLKICLNLTAVIGGITIIWGTIRLSQCSKMMENASIETTTNIDDELIDSSNKNELTSIKEELLYKYEILKKLNLKDKDGIKPDSDRDKNLKDKELAPNKGTTFKIQELNRNNSAEIVKINPDFSDYSELIDNVGENRQEHEEKLTEELEGCFDEACAKRGFDPEILIAMGKQENGLLEKSTGSAAGMLQIEGVNKYNKYNAYDYIGNAKDYVDFAAMNLNKVDDNINAAAVMLQELIERYPNDIKIAIHAYNYGYPIVDRAIKNAMAKSKNAGKSKNEITYEDIKEYLEDVHKNPKKYFSNWGNSTYGDGKYATRVMQRVRTRLVYAIIRQDNVKILTIYDMLTGQAIKKYTSLDLKSNVYYDKENHKYYKYEEIIDSINPNKKSAKLY